MLSNLVYKFKCEQCNATYYGETSRHLQTRVAEHKGLSPRTGHPLLYPHHSNIRDHSIQCNHPINSSNFSILYKTKSSYEDIKIAESILIKKDCPNLNSIESVNLNMIS